MTTLPRSCTRKATFTIRVGGELLALAVVCVTGLIGCATPKASTKLPPDAFEFEEPKRGRSAAIAPDKSKELKLMIARRRDNGEKSFAYMLRNLQSGDTLDWTQSNYDDIEFASDTDYVPATVISWSPNGKFVVIQERAGGLHPSLPMIVEVADCRMKKVTLPIKEWRESLGDHWDLLWHNPPSLGGFTTEGSPIIRVIARRYVYNGRGFRRIDAPPEWYGRKYPKHRPSVSPEFIEPVVLPERHLRK